MTPGEREIIFVVEEEADGGFVASSPAHGIFTQGDTVDELRRMVRDAVACAFDDKTRPELIRLHFVRDEVIAA